ncbi:TMEM165/GDT1 family protein [Actinoplanes sp. NPDC051633]|uniref:TMEM165/GDT1 family protein n=1 Tax=Actinoplanes sp. NPDC051633 TaxID=3155670 RepID=UPI0034174017
MELLTAALVAFVAIVPVELPDKTFVATLVLSTRYRPLPVYLGVLAAFGVQCLIAVLAGTLVSQLPRQPVAFVAAALFAIGAVVLVRGARKGEEISEEQAQDEYAGKITDERPGWRAALTSFLILFTAEWGDLSQLLTAGLVASGRPAVPVFFGSWAGLALVSGLAILLGRWLLKRVKLSLVRYVGATVCLILAIITVIEAVTA